MREGAGRHRGSGGLLDQPGEELADLGFRESRSSTRLTNNSTMALEACPKRTVFLLTSKFF